MTENKLQDSFDVRFLWVACAAVLIIYLLFPTQNYFFDGISFAQSIEDAPTLSTSLIHPNHLIYEGVGYVFHHLVQLIKPNIRAVVSLQILNSILGVVSIYVLFLILRRSANDFYISLCLALLFAFSATWWKFATDADAYVPGVLFMLISFYYLLPSQKPRPFLVAITFSVAMCFHQLAVVFGPVVVLGLFFQTLQLNRTKQLTTICTFGFFGLAITLGAYFAGFYAATHSHDLIRFAHWLTSFSPDGGFRFDFSEATKYTARGHVRLIFGGRVSLLKGFMNPLLWLVAIAMVVAVIALVVQLIRGWRDLKLPSFRVLKEDREHWLIVILCLLWTGCYLVFLFVWMPQHTFYRLFYFPALLVIAGILLTKMVQQHRYRLALFVAALALANFLFLTFPYSHQETIPPRAFANQMSKVWPAGTIVYYGAQNSDESLFRYFNPQTKWKFLGNNATGEIESDMALNKNVWLEVTAVDQLNSSREGNSWLTQHTRQINELKNPLFKIRFVKVGL